MRRQLAALFVFCVIDTLGFGILIPLVPYMAARFGVEPQYITPILGSYSLCQLLAAPFWGQLSDRYGRRPILMSSLAGACLSYVMLGFASNVWWLLASRMLAGFMAGNISAAFAYASDVSSPEKRAGTIGLVGAAIGIGFTLGQPVGGLLAGKDARRANFMAPAVVSFALSLLAIALVRFVLPESHTAEHRARHPQAPRRSRWRLLRERPAFAHLAAATLAVTFSQAILESIFAIWALASLRLGSARGGVSAVCRGAAGADHAGRSGACAGAALRRGAPRGRRGAGVRRRAHRARAGATFAATVVGLVLCGPGSAPTTRALPRWPRASRAATSAGRSWGLTSRARASPACSVP